MKIILVADYLSSEINGGGELNNEYLCDMLRSRGHGVLEKKSIHVTPDFIEENAQACFIVANFVELDPVAISEITKCRYIVYEHDHKYIKNRNPAAYENYIAPITDIINREFYRMALGVFCQSRLHAEIVRKNLYIDNVKNLGGNVWSEEVLAHIEKLSENPKRSGFSILNSPIGHKNTDGAIRYCESISTPYQLVSSKDYYLFLEKLSQCDKFVFIPETPETLSRVVVEARMMGMEVHTSSNVGATSEEWFSLKGKELIEEMRHRAEWIVDAVEEVFETGRSSHFTPKKSCPKISLVTSLYNGDKHIEGFLQNMIRQSIFEDCELIIIDANSPGTERRAIETYAEIYPNIIYKRLDYDPGIYGCWNIGIEETSGEYISNANVDDRRSLQQLEVFADVLSQNPEIDLVYSKCFVTQHPNETYSQNSSHRKTYPVSDFTPENMIKCLPGCMPLWRRSMHEKAGVFNDKYKFAGDWDMWLRAVRTGSAFKCVEGIHGLYYFNPDGLSTGKLKEKEKLEEEKAVFHEYAEIFGQRNYDAYKKHFS